MATKPIKFLELHYTMTQFLITSDILRSIGTKWRVMPLRCGNFPCKSVSNKGARYQNDICCRSIVLEGPCDQSSLPFRVPRTSRCDDFVAFIGLLGVVKLHFISFTIILEVVTLYRLLKPHEHSKARPQHRELRALLFSKSAWVL